MEFLSKTLLVGSGGFIGANVRYWLAAWVNGRLRSMIPWSTMIINVSGSFLLGLFMGIALAKSWRSEWRLFLAIGVLGGYTTYSTYSYEAARLLEDRSYTAAVVYMAGNALLSVVGAILGLILARAVAGDPT